MAAFPPPAILIRHLSTLGGLLAGGAVATTIGLAPTDLLEHLVWTSGVASLVHAAQPPLGGTARLSLAAGGGVLTGAVIWAALFLLFGPGGFFVPKSEDARAKLPSVRRADAHPDAPPRRPMTAADLGTPLMEVVTTAPVEQPLPTSLDEPLAAFDPAAIPAIPRMPQRVLPALAPGERLDTFDLVPPPPPRSAPAPAERDPAAPPSIDALLRRLEEGSVRRAVRA